MVDPDLGASADQNLDADWRFAIAYNAALQCAAMALKAAGYEAPKGGGAHHRTIESLRLTVGCDVSMIDALQAFRAKRAGAIYETAGVATGTEVEELRKLASELRRIVLAWIKKHHPALLK